jgi:hypothetical protein
MPARLAVGLGLESGLHVGCPSRCAPSSPGIELGEAGGSPAPPFWETRRPRLRKSKGLHFLKPLKRVNTSQQVAFFAEKVIDGSPQYAKFCAVGDRSHPHGRSSIPDGFTTRGWPSLLGRRKMRRMICLVLCAAMMSLCAATVRADQGAPSAALADMGLSGMQLMSDDEAMGIRGQGFSFWTNGRAKVIKFHHAYASPGGKVFARGFVVAYAR